MRDRWGRAFLVLTMISLGTGITACRKDEQDRPMTKQKGVYEGPVDEKLAEDRLEDLRLRASGQKF